MFHHDTKKMKKVLEMDLDDKGVNRRRGVENVH